MYLLFSVVVGASVAVVTGSVTEVDSTVVVAGSVVKMRVDGVNVFTPVTVVAAVDGLPVATVVVLSGVVVATDVVVHWSGLAMLVTQRPLTLMPVQ